MRVANLRRFEQHRASRIAGAIVAAVWIAASVGGTLAASAAEDEEYLGDRPADVSMTHRQDWGDFGVHTAAAKPGTVGTPMQIGAKTYSKGLGHHANGEIVIDLRGQYKLFRAEVGVQSQGGGRGSVKFQILVDNKVAWEAGPMTDSDPAKPVEVPLEHAGQLRLVATDAGDGISCDMANWAEARLVPDERLPRFGSPAVTFGSEAAPAPSAVAGGIAMMARATGPQVAVMNSASAWTVSVDRGEEVRVAIPLKNVADPLKVMVDVNLVRGEQAELEVSLGSQRLVRAIRSGEDVVLETQPVENQRELELVVATRGAAAEAGVRWSRLRYVQQGHETPIQVAGQSDAVTIPPPVLPDPRPSIEQQLIEWDWRMQDGIGTDREPRAFADAVATIFQRGDKLIQDLARRGHVAEAAIKSWEDLRKESQTLAEGPAATDAQWLSLWRRAHELRRRIAIENPLSKVGPLLFVKNVPSSFSHQLTQYAGSAARPGGGLFVLENPGQSMHCRELVAMPQGSTMLPDVSWDGQSVMFSFCKTVSGNGEYWRGDSAQFYHLFQVGADGSGLRQLTEGAWDDFAPRYLPDGNLLFLSTRRGGFHRCGRGPCPVHTMALANGDGSNPRVISFHETHEWDPAVLNDGRVIYTRWDYVDRNAVFYQQLWSARSDGSDVRAFYGNNTLNPVGVWEAKPVPGSGKVMATAAAHHAMTAGSIILIDPSRGVDGSQPISRLTEDVLFPESEFPVGPSWHNPAGVDAAPTIPTEEKRWPGHCYRSPYPLSEDYFLASYSYEPLVGEPLANRPNMFGIYLMDRWGNKELLYRDVSISSIWAMPLRSRPRPPAWPGAAVAQQQPAEGTFLLQNVYESWPNLSVVQGTVKRLRILQVLPKTTPNANSPRVGLANASPGKQVLGTVPVEADGSAYFRVPAGIPLSFQALDEKGMAVQTMRSLTYVQPGEHSSCVGCHEYRTTAPGSHAVTLAAQRPPSPITPGPDGSRPFSYAILVQPILDKHCVRCHDATKPENKVDLTGGPAGEFSVSYQALAPRVPFSEWKGTPKDNSEPQAQPGTFGARASSLMALLEKGHEDVSLSPDEIERLVTWMDTNALFYGTFSPADQQRQQRGERIEGPALQ